jgi:hypothetical protein
VHPLYINDLITKTKEDLRFSLANIAICLNELKTGVGTYEKVQLEWFMKDVEVNAHLLQHSLHQLNKHTEKHAGKQI